MDSNWVWKNILMPKSCRSKNSTIDYILASWFQGEVFDSRDIAKHENNEPTHISHIAALVRR